MNVPRTLTTALRIALTLLVATSVSAMMDILWTLTNTLAMVNNWNKCAALLAKIAKATYTIAKFVFRNPCNIVICVTVSASLIGME